MGGFSSSAAGAAALLCLAWAAGATADEPTTAPLPEDAPPHVAPIDAPPPHVAPIDAPPPHVAPPPYVAPIYVAPPPCPDSGDVVMVIARKRELWLCERGAAVGKFQVAMGRGGVDKRRQGDGRTPLGTYSLGTPRPSTRYGVFIPIHYPTPEQAAQGFTGREVGLHGPPRGLTVPEYPTTVIDWTDGCIATGLDAEIAFIADFVRERQPTLVVQ